MPLPLKKVFEFSLHWILPFLLAPIIWLYSKTWRLKESGSPEVLKKFIKNREPVIFAHWHGDELVLVPYYSYRNLSVLASLSKDGTIMARTLSLLGYQVFRGSSSRGGARGLIGLIRAVKQGSQAALAVDGPKGPIYEVKPGIIELAAKTGVPILPLRCFASHAWFIPRAWNKSYVPKAFSKVTVVYSTPIYVDDNEKKEQAIHTLCTKVATALNKISL